MGRRRRGGSLPGVAVVTVGMLMPLLRARVTVAKPVEPTPFFETTTVKAYSVPPVKMPNSRGQAIGGEGKARLWLLNRGREWLGSMEML